MGRERAIKGVEKCVGTSPYQARYGVHTHANGIYWIDVVGERPDGLLLITNLGEISRPPVESIQAAIETEFVFPLLRGRETTKWKAEPKHFILLAQDKDEPSKAITENYLLTFYPKTFSFLKYFEDIL
ncbi:MAG TPA: hypothetical protein VJ044_18725, partial [Candidatus Hodarchaeales archaeon]|nr:hypothetical protein [Candidatus Hodarchaeales archaeon]